jgi:protein phosphatase
VQEVAVYQGVNTSVVGMDLYRLHEATGLRVEDLTPAARNRVRDGITAADPADAASILSRLRDQQLPLCSALQAAASSSAAGAAASSTATDGTATDSTAAGEAAGAGGAAPSPAAPGDPALPTTATPTTPAAPMRTFQPGVDCREAG